MKAAESKFGPSSPSLTVGQGVVTPQFEKIGKFEPAALIRSVVFTVHAVVVGVRRKRNRNCEHQHKKIRTNKWREFHREAQGVWFVNSTDSAAAASRLPAAVLRRGRQEVSTAQIQIPGLPVADVPRSNGGNPTRIAARDWNRAQSHFAAASDIAERTSPGFRSSSAIDPS